MTPGRRPNGQKIMVILPPPPPNYSSYFRVNLLKEELFYDPAEEKWRVYIGPPNSQLFPYSRIARFKVPSAKVENLQNVTPLRMDQTLNAIKKRRLERFYKLSEKVQSDTKVRQTKV